MVSGDSEARAIEDERKRVIKDRQYGLALKAELKDKNKHVLLFELFRIW